MFYPPNQNLISTDNRIETSDPHQRELLLHTEISHTYIRPSVPENDDHTQIYALTSESTENID